VAHHRDAGVDDRLGAIDGCASAFQLDRVASGLLDETLCVGHGQLVGRLV